MDPQGIKGDGLRPSSRSEGDDMEVKTKLLSRATQIKM
jgi:hypothetical protein